MTAATLGKLAADKLAARVRALARRSGQREGMSRDEPGEYRIHQAFTLARHLAPGAPHTAALIHRVLLAEAVESLRASGDCPSEWLDVEILNVLTAYLERYGWERTGRGRFRGWAPPAVPPCAVPEGCEEIAPGLYARVTPAQERRL